MDEACSGQMSLRSNLPQDVLGRVFAFDDTYRRVYDNIVQELGNGRLRAMRQLFPKAKTIEYHSIYFLVNGQAYMVFGNREETMAVMNSMIHQTINGTVYVKSGRKWLGAGIKKLCKKVVIMGEDYYIYEIDKRFDSSKEMKVWQRLL